MANVVVGNRSAAGRSDGGLQSLAAFSANVVQRPLRPYQLEAAQGVLDFIARGGGGTIAVMIARQGGKNEVSAHLEAFLLSRFEYKGGSLIKAAPTFRPQLITSKMRLEQVLRNPLASGRWHSEWTYIVTLGQARCLFLSAQPASSVVGATAQHLLEFDEAQDISLEKHDKDFAPMGSTTNCTRVYWGTAWDETTLLQRVILANEELERKDGCRRNFIYPWWHVAECLPSYAEYVEAEKSRLGADHPVFQTQYELKVIGGVGGLFSPTQRAQLRGDHPRRREPERPIGQGSRSVGGLRAGQYVAAVDIAGEDEEASDAKLRAVKPRKDSTVVLIGELDRDEAADSGFSCEGPLEPYIRVVEVYWYTGRKHRELYPLLVDLLRNVWHVERVSVDASGIGAGIASFLEGALGEAVCERVVFSAAEKSALGFALLAAINGGRLKWFAPDGSAEDGEFWHEVAHATYTMGASQQMRWSVPESEGHDDFIVALALLVRAAGEARMEPAFSVVPARSHYWDGRY